MLSSEVKLTPRKFEDLCSLEYELFTCSLPSWPEFSQFGCLVVKFIGECGKGTQNSRGGYDDFMSAILKAAIEAWKPVCLIMDLRELKYQWGDEMGIPFKTLEGMDTNRSLLMSIFEEYPKLQETDLEKLRTISLNLPFSVIVSEKNRDGLTSLFEHELKKKPDEFLSEKLDEAVDVVDRQLQVIFKKP